MKRPDCYDFAMDFLGEPEKGEIHKYIELLENRIAELESVKQTHALDAAKVGCTCEFYDADMVKLDPECPKHRRTGNV